MDPNLLKFMEAHRREIKRGRLDRVREYVKDYLNFILPENPAQVETEMNSFMNKIHLMKEKNETSRRPTT